MQTKRLTEMKLLNSIYIIAIIVIAGLVINACDEDDDFELFVPNEVALGDTSILVYDDIVSFPVLDIIASDSPRVEYEGAFSFVIDSVREISGIAFENNRFAIDRSSGIVSYENAGELAPGTYVLDVGLSTPNGLAIFEEAISMEILDVPISLSVDNATVEAGALQTGTIATLSYTDNSGGEVTSVTYAFVEPVDGFAIDENTGEISKTGAAPSGSIAISISVTSNLGVKTFENVVTVNIGEAPTLKYFRADGITALSKVTLSPWTAYTTSAELDGMEAGGGFEVILPDELTSFNSAFSFDANGNLSISEGAGLAEGDHSIGVIATNSGGVSANFENLFMLTIEATWETVIFIDDDFDDPDNNFATPDVAYPGEWSAYTFGGGTGGPWLKVNSTGAGAFSGMRRFNPYEIDEGLVRAIDLSDVFAIRISFSELIGYGDAFINNYYRALYAGDDVTNAAAGSFVDSEWTPLLDTDGTWQGINWGGGNGPVNVYNNIVVDLSEISGDTLYLMWRLFPTETSTQSQNGLWLLDYFTAQKAAVTAAVEE